MTSAQRIQFHTPNNNRRHIISDHKPKPLQARSIELTVKERRFLMLWFEHDMDQTAAMTEMAGEEVENSRKRGRDKKMPEYSTIKSRASRMMKRIRSKSEWKDILDSANLGDFQLAYHIKRLLKAKRPIATGGKVIDSDDGPTQAKMVSLLAELRGKKKAAIEVGVQVKVKGYVSISPDDWDAEDVTPAEVESPAEIAKPVDPFSDEGIEKGGE